MKPKMNIRRLRAVAKRILKYPDTYEQEIFIDHDDSVKRGKKPAGLCGTRACIAGHALILAEGKKALNRENKSIYHRARLWLGLSKAQADDLFLSWPISWDDQLYQCDNDKQRARVAVAVIEELIEKGGL